ncbi:MAG: DEAD/DEAH box helicase family protein [Leptospiraceae bacterium]|nr:DEAD/DEAH box helicase family protein [Leptospiraceae bacterium]
MNLRDLNLKIRYRSSEDDLIKDFFVPVLNRSVFYKRAVGFFSSSALIQISKGLCEFIKNEGKIQIIASPFLQESDIEAMKKGYEEREKTIERVLLSSITEPKNYFEKERMNLLAHLIESRRLDIKIAFVNDGNRFGIYHEKIGLFYDTNYNKIAFTGSLNESSQSMVENFESIDVFCSWKENDSKERISEKEKDFEMLWNNQTPKVTVIEFPQVAKEKLQLYKKEYIKEDIDKEELYVDLSNKPNQKYPKIPEKLQLHDYQMEAIQNWKDANYQGIFNMATGTGKTITGLAAVANLSETLDHHLAIIIVCPYQHLVEQWVEDIKEFNMNPIVAYSTSRDRDWKDKLKNSVIDFKLNVIENFCFITTNATYSSEFVQSQIVKLKKDVVFVVDEAHNFGAFRLSKKMLEHIPYRLALSATLERYGDPEGTAKLYDYFGNECINYPLGKAILEGKLTHYRYYPILTNLTEDELSVYRKLSKEIAKYAVRYKNRKGELPEFVKKLAIKRARLVAGSLNKLPALEKAISKYKNSKHILVYCGATTISDFGYQDGNADESELKQIEAVLELLGNKMDMKVHRFTSQEDSIQRGTLKHEFEKGNLQALVAIKCLDEGVNIPKIQTAFILASSTNPKEYIQRRGRVLRLAKGKEIAEIYDFITIPRPLGTAKQMEASDRKWDLSLIKRELVRMKDFYDLSINPQDGYTLMEEIVDAYGIEQIQLEEEEYDEL